MRRTLALTLVLAMAVTTFLWIADAVAKSGGGSFRSGNRATRDDGAPSGGGSGYSSDQGSTSDDLPSDPTPPKRPKAPQTWYRSVRNLMFGGFIGTLFLGKKLGGFGLLEVLVLSGLIALAFRALSQLQTAPVGQYAGHGGGAIAALGDAGPPVAVVPQGQDAIERALADIRQADPGFEPAAFAATVETMFRTVQAAWTARNIVGAADVLTVELREKLQKECDRLRATGRINRVERIALKRAAITEARQERGWDLVTVYIVAALIDYTTDEAGLKVVEGNPFQPVNFQERWELLRPSGPYPWRVRAIH
jgi:predicted lipid-binding transport protein (Tim44 family)